LAHPHGLSNCRRNTHTLHKRYISIHFLLRFQRNAVSIIDNQNDTVVVHFGCHDNTITRFANDVLVDFGFVAAVNDAHVKQHHVQIRVGNPHRLVLIDADE
jgi:hypothetical protein